MNIKGILKFSVLSLKHQLQNVGFYMILLIILILLKIVCAQLGVYLKETDGVMNIFELYTWLLAGGSRIIYMLGLLVIIFGCGFFHNQVAYCLVRMTRTEWILSHVLYLVIISVIYNIFFLVCFWICCGGAITFDGVWSDAAYVGKDWIGAIGIQMVMYIHSGFFTYNPNFVGLLTMVFSVIASVIVGMLLVAFSLMNKGIFGIACFCGFYFGEIVLVNIMELKNLSYLFPFGCTNVSYLLLDSSRPNLLYGGIYCAVLCAVLLILLIKIASKVDFAKMDS